MVKHVNLRSSSGRKQEQKLLQHYEPRVNLLMGKICGVAQRCQSGTFCSPIQLASCEAVGSLAKSKSHFA